MDTQKIVSAVINLHHGWAVAEQFEDTINGQDFSEQNDNALMYISDTIKEIIESEILSDAANDYIQNYFDNLKEYLNNA